MRGKILVQFTEGYSKHELSIRRSLEEMFDHILQLGGGYSGWRGHGGLEGEILKTERNHSCQTWNSFAMSGDTLMRYSVTTALRRSLPSSAIVMMGRDSSKFFPSQLNSAEDIEILKKKIFSFYI